MRKGVLFLALVLPALVFVFLKRFGRNEFSVPVFHEQVAEWTVPGCAAGSIPLRVTASQDQRRIRVVTTQPISAIERDLSLLAQNLDSNLFRIIAADRDSVRCHLLLRDTDTEVLLDSAGRVRGYYHVGSREETDRLILEMRILLKQY